MEFKLNKQREALHFKTPISSERSWILGLTSLVVYNSIFNLTEKNNKLELYTQHLDSEFPFNELKDKVAEALGLSDISIEEKENEIYGPNIIKTYIKLSTENSQNDGCYIFLLIFI